MAIHQSTQQLAPVPKRVVLHGKSRVLELGYGLDQAGQTFKLSFEFLRVHSPSAEVRGHGRGQEILQVGKGDVTINQLEPVGNYAVQPTFSDGHNTGIFSWEYLWYLCQNQKGMWQTYLDAMAAAGQSRGVVYVAPEAAPAMKVTALSRSR